MSILIVFYSRTGFNKKIARLAQEILSGDIDEIADMVDRAGENKMFRNAMAAVFKKTTKLAPAEKNPQDYDAVLMQTPFWSGVLPPATRTYLHQNRNKFKRVFLLSVSNLGAENKRAVPDFEKVSRTRIEASLLLKEEDIKQDSYEEKLDKFLSEIKI